MNLIIVIIILIQSPKPNCQFSPQTIMILLSTEKKPSICGPDWNVCIVRRASRRAVLGKCFSDTHFGEARVRNVIAKCYCTIWKVHQTHITRSQNAQQEVKKGKIHNQSNMTRKMRPGCACEA